MKATPKYKKWPQPKMITSLRKSAHQYTVVLWNAHLKQNIYKLGQMQSRNEVSTKFEKHQPRRKVTFVEISHTGIKEKEMKFIYKCLPTKIESDRYEVPASRRSRQWKINGYR